jgi:hypothetical protein
MDTSNQKKMKCKTKVELDSTLFWSMYNALRDAEGVLWSCDGATNPEDEDLVQEISDTSEQLTGVLDKLQKIVSQLKEE